MTIKKIILLCAFGIIATAGFTQVNFFGADDDAQTKDFYKRSMHYTAVAVCNFQKFPKFKEDSTFSFPEFNAGAAFLLHLPTNRISFYFDAKVNAKQQYKIYGTKIDNAEKTTTPVLDSVVSYQSLLANVGIARAVTRNWIIYAAVGVSAQNTNFKNKHESGQNFTIPRQGVRHNFGAGVLYVTDKKFTFQLGMDLLDRSINTGIGYTW